MVLTAICSSVNGLININVPFGCSLIASNAQPNPPSNLLSWSARITLQDLNFFSIYFLSLLALSFGVLASYMSTSASSPSTAPAADRLPELLIFLHSLNYLKRRDEKIHIYLPALLYPQFPAVQYFHFSFWIKQFSDTPIPSSLFCWQLVFAGAGAAEYISVLLSNLPRNFHLIRTCGN
jgi:hypothetical protein